MREFEELPKGISYETLATVYMDNNCIVVRFGEFEKEVMIVNYKEATK